MSQKLHDITLYYYFDNDEVRKRFTLRHNVVSDLYVHFLEGYKPPKTTRISVTLKDNGQPINNTTHFGSVLSVDARFDREQFWTKNDETQKQIILDTIHATAIECACKFNWNTEVFHRAYQKVKESNFVFRIETARKLSPNRNMKGSLLIEKNEEKTIICANFYDAQDEALMTIHLFDSFQNNMFYGDLVKNYRWFNNSEFGVCSKTKELKIFGDCMTGQSKTAIEPKQNSRDVIEGYLRYVSYRELRTEKDIAEWITDRM